MRPASILTVSLLALMFFSPGAGFSDCAGDGEVEFLVKDGSTGLPISATVSLEGECGYKTATDANGVAGFDAVVDGSYSVTVIPEGAGYESWTGNITVNSELERGRLVLIL